MKQTLNKKCILAVGFVLLTLGLPAYGAEPKASADAAPVAEEATPEEAAAEEKITVTPEEQKVIDGYKSQMNAIRDWFEDYRYAETNGEADAHRIPLLISAKLATVKTAGLPEKISKPFAALRANIDAQAALLKELPKDNAAAMEWMIKKLEDQKWAQSAENLRAEQFELENALTYAAAPYGAGKESDIYQSSELSQFKDRWVVILGSYKEFNDAQATAKKLAQATKMTFSLNGMIYDQKGLRMPDDFEDEVYAGQYVQRRGNETLEGEKVIETHISVEDSTAYEGFTPQYFIVVGYIAESAEEAEKKAAEFKKHAPDTYVKKTEIFMGCDR